MSIIQIAEPEPIGEEVLTVADTAVGFALTGMGKDPPDEAHCQVRDAEISIRTDGTAPTATIGTFMPAYHSFRLTTGKDIAQFKAIRTGSISGKIHAKFERYPR